MKSRALWFLVVVAAVVLVARLLRHAPEAPAPLSPSAQFAKPAAVTGAVSANSSAALKPKIEVAIQDGKTIDFSSGAAVVKDDAKDKEALAKALKEMDEAVSNMTLPSSSAAPAPSMPAASEKK